MLPNFLRRASVAFGAGVFAAVPSLAQRGQAGQRLRRPRCSAARTDSSLA